MAALAALGCDGCQAPVYSLGPDELVIEGDVVRFHYLPEAPPCAGTVPYLDDVSKRLAEFLGVGLPDRIDYYYYGLPEPRLPCSSGDGCSNGTSIASWNPHFVHELVHVIEESQRGESASFFMEGVAVALGEAEVVGSKDYDLLTDEILAAAPLPVERYALAGDFVSFLLEEYGAATFGRLLTGVGWGSDAVTIRQVFSDAYGLSLEEAVETRKASGREYETSSLGFPYCQLDLVPIIGAGWHVQTELACETNGIGPWLNSDQAVRYFAIEATEEGFNRLQITTEAGGSVSLRPCKAGWGLDYSWRETPYSLGVVGQTPSLFVGMTEGRYYLGLNNTVGDATEFAISFEPAAVGAVTATCPQSVEPAVIGNDVDGIYLAPVPGQTADLAIRVPEARNSTVMARWAEPGVCSGSCDAGACVGRVAGDTLMLEPGTTYHLFSSAERFGSVVGLVFPR